MKRNILEYTATHNCIINFILNNALNVETDIEMAKPICKELFDEFLAYYNEVVENKMVEYKDIEQILNQYSNIRGFKGGVIYDSLISLKIAYERDNNEYIDKSLFQLKAIISAMECCKRIWEESEENKR